MAVAIDTSTIYGFNTAVSSDSRSFTIGASANFLLLLLSSRNTGRTFTPTYNGVSLTQLGTPLQAGNVSEIDTWYLVNPATGAHTLAVSWNLTSDITVCPISFTGVDTTTPFRSQGANNYVEDSGNPNTTASSTVTSATGDLVIDWLVYVDSTGDAPTMGAGQTQIQTLRQSNVTRGTSSWETGAASVVMSETFPSRQYNHRAFALRASTTGSSTAHHLTLMGVGA